MNINLVARKLTKDVDLYIHPNQVRRYIEGHPELRRQSENECYRALRRHFIKRAEYWEKVEKS